MTRYESFLAAARASTRPSAHEWYTPEAIAALATEQNSCVWHAAWSLSLAHLPELGYTTCRLCGGVLHPQREDAHGLCLARERRGLPTPMIDSTPQCSCARCTASRWSS